MTAYKKNLRSRFFEIIIFLSTVYIHLVTMPIGPNPYTPSCFAPRDRLTWLHIMSETTATSEDWYINRQEELCIQADKDGKGTHPISH